MRFAGNFASGMSARYFPSTSLHAMPRGADPRGASTVLVNRAPEVVTIVTVPPQAHAYLTGGGAGSGSTRSLSRVTAGLENFASVACTQVKSRSATADATKYGRLWMASTKSFGRRLPATVVRPGPATRIFATASGAMLAVRAALTAASSVPENGWAPGQSFIARKSMMSH